MLNSCKYLLKIAGFLLIGRVDKIHGAKKCKKIHSLFEIEALWSILCQGLFQVQDQMFLHNGTFYCEYCYNRILREQTEE